MLLRHCDQARNQLGTPGGGEEFSERSPNFSNYVQYFSTMLNIFLQREKRFAGGGFATPGYGPGCDSYAPFWHSHDRRAKRQPGAGADPGGG